MLRSFGSGNLEVHDRLYAYGIVFRVVCVFTGMSHQIPPVSRSDEGGIW